jgi:hypothetical protein
VEDLALRRHCTRTARGHRIWTTTTSAAIQRCLGRVDAFHARPQRFSHLIHLRLPR